MSATFDPVLTREVNSTLGGLFLLPLLAPQVAERTAAAGFHGDDRMAWYFGFRSAPMGRASAETVIATYFNFPPGRIRRHVPRVWDIAEPAVVLDVLADVIDASMGEPLADVADSPELRELAELLTAAAATAFARPEGRPLFAGIADIDWPSAPHAQVWYGMHAFREFRGDGHVAVLTSHNLTGLEALVLHGAMGIFAPEALRQTRGWSQEEWDATVDVLRARGLLAPDEVVLSDQGREFRDGIEHRTDELAMPAYTGIGEEGIRRILELAPPIVEQASGAASRAARGTLLRRDEA